MSFKCKWCESPRKSNQIYCSKRCRQSAYRFRRDLRIETENKKPKRLAYADPPYPGFAKKYYGNEDTYAGEVDHVRLLQELATYDGWALSTSSKALRDILPLCPEESFTMPWVKPNPPSPRTRGPHSRWEPLIVVPSRLLAPGFSDWLLAQPARFGGDLMGRKPIAFCQFLFTALGALPGDSLDDMFPGTGIVSSAWRVFSSLTPVVDTSSGSADVAEVLPKDSETSPVATNDTEGPFVFRGGRREPLK